MIHIAICDRSIDVLLVYEGALNKYCSEIFPKTLSYKILKGFEREEQVLQYIACNPIDALFLDAEMSSINGFELAKKLLLINKELIIIFTYDNDKYTCGSFDFAPFDSMQKDKLIDELPRIVMRLSDKFERAKTYVKLQSTDGDYTISAKDVIYISAKRNYYVCHLKKGQIRCRGTLGDAENLFGKFDIIRIHRSYMINLNYVRGSDSKAVIVEESEKSLPIAQNRLPKFQNAYAEFNTRRSHI